MSQPVVVTHAGHAGGGVPWTALRDLALVDAIAGGALALGGLALAESRTG